MRSKHDNLAWLICPIEPLCADAGASGAGARGGADAAPPAFVGDGEGGAGAAATTGDDWEIVGNTEQPAQTVAAAERPAAVTGALMAESIFFEFGLGKSAMQKLNIVYI